MLSFLQTLFLTLAIIVLSHEVDAILTDKFEETTGTELRVLPLAQSIQDDEEEPPEQVVLVPAYTKKTRSIRTRIAVGNFYDAMVNFGGGSAAGRAIIPVNIVPARL